MELGVFFSDSVAYREFSVALAIFLVFVLFSWLTQRMFKFYSKKVSVLTKSTLDDELLEALRRPVTIAILLFGVYVSLNVIPLLEPYTGVITQVAKIIGVIILAYTATNLFNAFARWYMHEVAVGTASTFDDKYMPALRKLMAIIIYLLAGLLILGELEIEITPLIASLGIGGLAVALALQDTLANFFAGAYIVADKPFKPGDYISFEGNEGYVMEIGWRSTKIKTLSDNVIVVPNSKLAQSMITNYYLPGSEMAFTIPVGVSYDSDLDKVEKVTMEVAKKVLMDSSGGVKTFEPFIRYNKFDEFSINFSVIMRVEKFVDKYLLTHEFIKSLKRRYNQEGIEIPYPIRTVHLKEK